MTTKQMKAAIEQALEQGGHTHTHESVLRNKAEHRLSQALELVMAFMVTGKEFGEFRIQKRNVRGPADTPYIKDVFDFATPTDTPGKFRITVENWNDASQAPKLDNLATDETEEQAEASMVRTGELESNVQFD